MKCARRSGRRVWRNSRPTREFSKRVDECRDSLLAFLAAAKREGKRVAAYGAAAKGNTLLNFCGVGVPDIAFVADRNPHKQSKFLPGTHIPVVSPEELMRAKPDYVLILPWNLRDEISQQLHGHRGMGRAIRHAGAGGADPDPMIFTESPLPGAFLVDLEPLSRRARFFCPQLLRR